MSICSTDKILGFSDIRTMFMELSPNHHATISLCLEPDGGSKRDLIPCEKGLLLWMPVCGSFSFTDPDGGSWKTPLAGSVTISGQQQRPLIHVTMATHTLNELVFGESSPCHKRTP